MLALLGLITKNWQAVIIAGLLLTTGLLDVELKQTHKNLVKEQASHQLDISMFKQAQQIADTNAKAQVAAMQKEYTTNAQQADINYSNLYTKYKSVLVQYSANQGAAKHVDSVPQADPAQSGNGSSSNPQLSVSTIDAQICAENTARLQAVHDWAEGLLK